jgi:hypothetical protein
VPQQPVQSDIPPWLQHGAAGQQHWQQLLHSSEQQAAGGSRAPGRTSSALEWPFGGGEATATIVLSGPSRTAMGLPPRADSKTGEQQV